MNMHHPAHPGELLSGWLADLGMTVTAFAEHLGVSRIMLSRVVNARSAVSAGMDLRLSEALGTSPGYWLALQAQRDLWTARRTAKSRKRIKRVATREVEKGNRRLTDSGKRGRLTLKTCNVFDTL